MKLKFIFLFLFSGFILNALGQEIPAKTNQLVNDFTNTLNASQISVLEQKLVAFDDSTSNQVAVVIVKSVGDYDINEYALELGRKWGVGGKTKNNGVVLLVALGDRKISIQTGYGLEGALPDVYTKRIIENDIKPYFKNGQYFEGINSGIDSIIKLTKGEYKNENPKRVKDGRSSGSAAIIVIFIIILVIILMKRGGGGGGNGQIIGGKGVSDLIFWSMLLGSGRNNSGDDWGSGFGGGFGGGSGGGFGGFGGGSFGGGGSSGSW